MIVNKGVWNNLDDGTRSAVQKAADETGAACAAKSAQLANWYFEQLESNGMKVEDASPAFLKELQAIGAKFVLALGDNFYWRGVKSIADPLWKSV